MAGGAANFKFKGLLEITPMTMMNIRCKAFLARDSLARYMLSASDCRSLALIFLDVLPLGSVKQGWVGENKIFSSFMRISKSVADSSKILLITNRKLHMRFRLAPRSMILDDLELL